MRYTVLYFEAASEVEADGTPLAIPSVVDRVLARNHVAPDVVARWRPKMVVGLTKLIEFPCEADLGPTLQCRFMRGHLEEGLDHEPTRRVDEPLAQEIDEWLYLLEAERDLRA